VELIPVIDLMGGVVVRGVGGRRHEYRPIRSRLCDSADPIAVGRALVEHFRPRTLYLADLDAIAGASPAWVVYRDLRALGVGLWVDAGVHSADEALALADVGIEGVVCGLETLPGPDALSEVIERVGPGRIIFSLDLKNGELLNPAAEWGGAPLDVAGRAIAPGVRRLIVLDLARVGEGEGAGTEELCARITSAHREVKVYAGGGVRGPDDLRRLAASGVAGALVASALHDGRIAPPPQAGRHS
jgi:phosphoribosylformimino-5-aminoimidazole carboxamide ribotide isomerase